MDSVDTEEPLGGQVQLWERGRGRGRGRGGWGKEREGRRMEWGMKNATKVGDT